MIENLCETCLDKEDCYSYNNLGFECYNEDDCDDLVRYAIELSNEKGDKMTYFYKSFEDLPENLQEQWNREVKENE